MKILNVELDFLYFRKSAKKDKSGPKQAMDELSTKSKVMHPFSFPDDQGSNNSGFYELQAVLTHKGRTSSSGHYVAWVYRKIGVFIYLSSWIFG